VVWRGNRYRIGKGTRLYPCKERETPEMLSPLSTHSKNMLT
jgi:hypothetical protein